MAVSEVGVKWAWGTCTFGPSLCKAESPIHNSVVTTPYKRGRPAGYRKTGGRSAGTPNKATREFREAVNAALSANLDNIPIWLKAVAEGDLALGRLPDPARALDIVAKLAEYVAPKMARIEHAGAAGQAAQPMSIQIEFVDAKAPAYINGDASD